jgi:hypothetical protein
MVDLRDSALVPLLSAVSIGRIPHAHMQEAVVEAMADPDPANMFMRLFYLFQRIGLFELANDMHAKALERRRVFRLEGPADPRIRLLAIMGPDPERDNSPVEYLVENSDIRLEFYYHDVSRAALSDLPDHDIALVAIGESDRGNGHLLHLEKLIRNWPRPVLNRPAAILHCARDKIALLLGDVEGLVVPLNRRMNRHMMKDLAFPIVIRPIDAHGGKGFAKIDHDEALRHYLATHEQAEFYAADYLDYRSADGQFRKYRIALINHEPHLCHLAITDHWMVHYIAAGMEVSADKQAEEAHAFAEFHKGFGHRHRDALANIARLLDLDFVVLDCAELPDGRLLLFEADNRGWVHAVDPADIFPYKAAHMASVFSAFRAMLLRKMVAGSPT